MKVSPDDTPESDEPLDVFGGYRLDGLYVFGPVGMRCVLAALIFSSELLRVHGSTPEAERKVKIRTRAAELQRRYSLSELQAMDAARRQVRSGFGLYGRARKPANSGRKRRAA